MASPDPRFFGAQRGFFGCCIKFIDLFSSIHERISCKMPVSKYEAFLKAAELGSLTRAAAELGVTQSAVSHMIGTLEEELASPY